MPDTLKPEEPLDIAIVGGGIVGLALVLGLQHRGIRVTLYEKTSAFRPIGAGIGFTPNSLRALELLHPKAIEAQRRVTTPNGDPKNPNDWLTYLDGYHVNSDNPNDTEEKLLFQLHTGFRGFEGCVRAHLLDEFLKLIPPETIKFSKSIDQVIDQGVDKKVLLQFEDGTTAGADAGKTPYTCTLLHLPSPTPEIFPPLPYANCTLTPSYRLRWHQITRSETHPWFQSSRCRALVQPSIRSPRFDSHRSRHRCAR